MAESASIQKVSVTHDQIMNWLILNPGVKQKLCADHFGITQAWLSTVIHSDVFQAKLKERQEEIFGSITQTVPERLAALGDMVTEQLAEQLEKNQDKEFTLNAFDKIMHRSGYAPQSTKIAAPSVTNNTVIFGVDKEMLARARASIGGQSQVEEKEVGGV